VLRGSVLGFQALYFKAQAFDFETLAFSLEDLALFRLLRALFSLVPAIRLFETTLPRSFQLLDLALIRLSRAFLGLDLAILVFESPPPRGVESLLDAAREPYCSRCRAAATVPPRRLFWPSYVTAIRGEHARPANGVAGDVGSVWAENLGVGFMGQEKCR
jgi:hypothetical protein